MSKKTKKGINQILEEQFNAILNKPENYNKVIQIGDVSIVFNKVLYFKNGSVDNIGYFEERLYMCVSVSYNRKDDVFQRIALKGIFSDFSEFISRFDSYMISRDEFRKLLEKYMLYVKINENTNDNKDVVKRRKI